jgi:hypothetical protein
LRGVGCSLDPFGVGSFPKFAANGRGSPSGDDRRRGELSLLDAFDELSFFFDGPPLEALFFELELSLLLSSFSAFLAKLVRFDSRPTPVVVKDDPPSSANNISRRRYTFMFITNESVKRE